MIKDQGEKQVEALNTLESDSKKLTIEDVIPRSAFASDEAKEEIEKIVKIEKTIDQEKLIYKSNKNTYDFRRFQTIRTFGEDMYDSKITLEEADKDQLDLTNEIENFNNKTRLKNYNKKQEKEIVHNNLYKFFAA